MKLKKNPTPGRALYAMEDADPTTVEGLRDRLSETYAAIKALDEQRARLNDLVQRDELALRLAMGLPIDRNGGLPY